MSMYDRDWYREDYQRKEKEYGGDFSLHSKKVNFEQGNQKQKEKEYTRNINQKNTKNNYQKDIQHQNKNAKKIMSILTIILCPIFACITCVGACFAQDVKTNTLFIPGFTLLLGWVLFFEIHNSRNTIGKHTLNTCACVISLVTAVIAIISIIIIIIRLFYS